MFTSFHKRYLLHHRKHHRKRAASAAAAATTTKNRLSDATTDITKIGMKTKAALKVANEHLSTTTTLVVINAIYLCVAT